MNPEKFLEHDDLLKLEQEAQNKYWETGHRPVFDEWREAHQATRSFEEENGFLPAKNDN